MAAVDTAVAPARAEAPVSRRRFSFGPILVNGTLALICLLWTIPTFGLLVSSVRDRADINVSGWWTVLPHQAWFSASQVQLQTGLDLTQPVNVNGTIVSDDQLRAGFVLPDGQRMIWANRRARLVDVQQQQWTMNTNLNLDNYRSVLSGQQITYTTPDGNTVTDQGQDLSGAFFSTLTVAIPATVIPILIAAFAAYGFAWTNFRGRFVLFAMIVALLVVPLQVALIPLLRDFLALNINGTYLALWLAHTGFGLPLATYLLYNYISGLPREVLESAFIDGASNFTIFTRLILPLSVPALASFAIFQFLWVWNDYLVALIFLGTSPQTQVITMRLASIVGSRGQDWYLLTSGAFISMLLPLTVFFALQRYFVRGLMAGSVKG
jgi:alpha-glucoside transport system permease protein